MDYQRYRELRLPIGSGTLETACKNVVAARLKQSGMMWSVDGAKGMLQLRASLKSRRLMSDFDSLLPLSPTQETPRRLPDRHLQRSSAPGRRASVENHRPNRYSAFNLCVSDNHETLTGSSPQALRP